MARPFGEGFGSETGVILARPTARALVSGEVSRVGQGVGSEEMKRWYFSTLVFLPPLSTNSVIRIRNRRQSIRECPSGFVRSRSPVFLLVPSTQVARQNVRAGKLAV